MTWQEWAKQYLVEERARKLKIIALLEAGTIGTSEMRDRTYVDTSKLDFVRLGGEAQCVRHADEARRRNYLRFPMRRGV